MLPALLPVCRARVLPVLCEGPRLAGRGEGGAREGGERVIDKGSRTVIREVEGGGRKEGREKTLFQ